MPLPPLFFHDGTVSPGAFLLPYEGYGWHYSWPWVAAGVYHTAGFCWTAINIFPASSEQPPGRPKLNKGLLELLGAAACPA